MINKLYCAINFNNNDNNISNILECILNKINFKKLIIITSNKKKFSKYNLNKIEYIEQNDINESTFLHIFDKNINIEKLNKDAIITNNHKYYSDFEGLSLGIPHFFLDKKNILPKNELSKKSEYLIKENKFNEIIGTNIDLLKALETANSAFKNNLESLVIYGNKGTGRSLLANCLIEDKKTLFLDKFSDSNKFQNSKDYKYILIKNIDQFSIEKQQTLIKLLKNTNNKIISTATKNLFKMVHENLFSLELLEKIMKCNVTISDLKMCSDGDIELLAHNFLSQKLNNDAVFELTSDAIDAMSHYSWPLNIAELQLTLTNAIALCKPEPISNSNVKMYKITAEELQLEDDYSTSDLKDFDGNFKLNAEVNALEKRYIVAALKYKALGITQVSKILGLSNSPELTRKMQKHNIKNPFPPRGK